MKSRASLSLVAFLMATGLPALCQNPDAATAPAPSPASAVNAADDKTKTEAQEPKPAGPKVPFTRRVISCVTGTAVGIPVCMVRRSKYEDLHAVKQMTNTDNKVAKGALRAFWMPFAIVTGVCESPADGTINAIRNSSRPFSKDQMSLGELKQNVE
jgi:hypothetical protein